MNEPRRHHFIPQSYQKLFWDETQCLIAELDVESGVVDWFNPKSRCWSPYLYRTDGEFAGFKQTHLENPIFSGIDDSYPKAVRALKFGDRHSVDRMAIATYIGFLRFRNPWALSKVDSCSDEAIKRALFARINAGQITVPQGLNLRTSSADAFLDDLNSIEISWGKDGRLTAMLGLSLLFSDELLKSKWRLFHSPSGGYVTSDKPVSANEVETESGLLRYILTPLSSHWMLQVG